MNKNHTMIPIVDFTLEKWMISEARAMFPELQLQEILEMSITELIGKKDAVESLRNVYLETNARLERENAELRSLVKEWKDEFAAVKIENAELLAKYT